MNILLERMEKWKMLRTIEQIKLLINNCKLTIEGLLFYKIITQREYNLYNSKILEVTK